MKRIKLSAVQIVLILGLGLIVLFLVHHVQQDGFQYVLHYPDGQ